MVGSTAICGWNCGRPVVLLPNWRKASENPSEVLRVVVVGICTSSLAGSILPVAGSVCANCQLAPPSSENLTKTSVLEAGLFGPMSGKRVES